MMRDLEKQSCEVQLLLLSTGKQQQKVPYQHRKTIMQGSIIVVRKVKQKKKKIKRSTLPKVQNRKKYALI